MAKSQSWPMQRGSVFFEDAADSSRLSRATTAGEIRRLARGLYTADPSTGPEELVARNRWQVVAHFVPDALIADRSAVDGGRLTAGTLFIVSDQRTTPLRLPGLVVVPRKGPKALEDDLPWTEGLRLSSIARALVDNLATSRGRAGRPARTLSRPELEDWIARLSQRNTPTQLNRIRDRAKEIAMAFGRQEAADVLDDLIGTTLGTREVRATGRLLAARTRGADWDPHRLELFERVARELDETIRSEGIPEHLVQDEEAGPGSTLPFYEAYFSNFIEGTEFTVDEAERIVEEGAIPENRPEDAHDILGTYRLVSDESDRGFAALSPDEFIDQLRRWNGMIMAGRPGMHPGEWKRAPNQAGSYVFVTPDLVEGTLIEGFGLIEQLSLPLARALYAMFLVSEVHPFADGNGRLARAAMNGALSAADETRIIVPIVWRNEYLTAMRQLSREARVDLFVRTLGIARQWTALIPWSDPVAARAQLEATNAFLDSGEAELSGRRLLIPA